MTNKDPLAIKNLCDNHKNSTIYKDDSKKSFSYKINKKYNSILHPQKIKRLYFYLGSKSNFKLLDLQIIFVVSKNGALKLISYYIKNGIIEKIPNTIDPILFTFTKGYIDFLEDY